MTRRSTGELRNWLKTATKLLIGDLGGLAAAASCTRVGQSHLSDYGNVNAEKMMPVDVVLDLESVGGVPRVTGALAQALGYGLVIIKPARPESELAILAAELGKDAAKTLGDAAAALTHKKLKTGERLVLMRDLDGLIACAEEMLGYLKGQAE